MKIITTVIVLFLSSLCLAQTGSIKHNQLTGADLNEATYKIDAFTGRKMRLSKNGDQEFVHKSPKEVLVVQRFQKFNNPDQTLTITYNTTPREDHRMYINYITLQGDRDLLIEFYVKYWDTTINFTEDPNDFVVTNNYLNDVVTLGLGSKDVLTVMQSQ